jgi:hypothetical protein
MSTSKASFIYLFLLGSPCLNSRIRMKITSPRFTEGNMCPHLASGPGVGEEEDSWKLPHGKSHQAARLS